MPNATRPLDVATSGRPTSSHIGHPFHPDRSAPTQPLPPGDHRVAVARERRERMRSRLLAATLAISSREEGMSEAVVIRHVVEQAGVSRATFYKHFSSLDQAVTVLGNQLSDEMLREMAPLQQPFGDAPMLAAIGIQLFLWRAVHDRDWGRFVARNQHAVSDSSTYITEVGRRLVEGRERGDFAFARLDAVLAMAHGALKEGMTILARGVPDPSGFIAALAHAILVGLTGAGPSAAETIGRAACHIAETAPALYPWWPPDG